MEVERGRVRGDYGCTKRREAGEVKVGQDNADGGCTGTLGGLLSRRRGPGGQKSVTRLGRSTVEDEQDDPDGPASAQWDQTDSHRRRHSQTKDVRKGEAKGRATKSLFLRCTVQHCTLNLRCRWLRSRFYALYRPPQTLPTRRCTNHSA